MSSSTHNDGGPSVPDVRERLDRVTDPELDESIVELGYVDDITPRGSTVDVTFSLPTAWCSPAFAWMMAVDARDEVESLPSVETATVTLRDHMHDSEITEGVNARASFASTFPDADGDVASIRASLDDKARVGRQFEALNALVDAGLTDRQIVELRREDLSLDDGAVFVRDGSVGISVDREPLAEYVEKVEATGLVETGSDVLFRTPEGDPISPDEFDLVHKRSRLANVNMTGQGNICDALNEARFDPDRPETYGPDGEES
ncbi:iron-sulfur cluster assembly protein [Halogeometricum sp. S1BR25-6]|uniref:Iron-sulfur cluster assembly protein n=1 Tax=Halogeometricum salsisoli TaxID=2950536 RepID=A0ABU2GAT8_9EURY|nr:iron-sulfur cluster assembly protein [Halogeometricum sp. S1BR25-6]MDS0297915.1 iron-sulfur cluster assembly protein [Halogeometricum sp. S1BR25-6]